MGWGLRGSNQSQQHPLCSAPPLQQKHTSVPHCGCPAPSCAVAMFIFLRTRTARTLCLELLYTSFFLTHATPQGAVVRYVHFAKEPMLWLLSRALHPMANSTETSCTSVQRR